jgi:DNA/RNA-binding domain of Phe-tRNA-synthetase-like protein
MAVYEFVHTYYILKNDEKCTCESKSVLPSQSCIQQEEDLYQKIGLKFKKETCEMLHLEHRTVWC